VSSSDERLGDWEGAGRDKSEIAIDQKRADKGRGRGWEEEGRQKE
jgi:hypothetical protein